MADNRSFNFNQTEKMKRLDGLTTKGGEEDPWAGIDEVISIGRKTPRRDDITKGIIAQRQDCMVAKQTIATGIVSTSQPFNGLISGITSSLPDVEKIIVPNLRPQPIADNGFEMTGTPKGHPAYAMDFTVKNPVDNEEDITSKLWSSFESNTARNNGGRPTFAVNVQSPTVNTSSLPDVDILDAPNKFPRPLSFEMTGRTEVSPHTIGTRANAHVDNTDPKPDPRSIEELNNKDSYPEDYTFVVNKDSPIRRNSNTRTPELDSPGRQKLGGNTEEETPQILRDLGSGDDEYDKEKDMNPRSWLDRVPGEEIIDITARANRVYTPYLIQQREKKMAAVRQQARQRYANRKINIIGKATVPTIPSRTPNNKKKQGRYNVDILDDEEHHQTEEHRPTDEHIRPMEQHRAEEHRWAEQYRKAEEYFSSIPTEYVEQWSKDGHVSASEYRQLACIAYSHPRSVTSSTATREDRARLLKASNDRRAQARSAATELPSETTWCVGYDVSSNRTPSPAYYPGRYIIENHPHQENKSSRFRYSKKRPATVIKVVPKGGRNPVVITDNNTKTGPFRRGIKALRNGLRRVGQSLQELMSACTCSSWDDTDL